MATLKIPESDFSVLRKIAELDEPVFLDLVKAIGETDPSLLQSDFSGGLASKVSGIKHSDLKSILKIISALYSIMENRKKLPEDLTTDLVETIDIEKPRNFPVEKAGVLKTRVQKLLSFDKIIGLASKAMDVMTDQDHIFCGLKVLSDIRPVFQNSPDSISAAMVIHNMRIAYHQDGKHTEFSVAMNPEDIRKTIEVLERAEKKSKALKSFIQKSGVAYFEDME
jgi:hypothetical protein